MRLFLHLGRGYLILRFVWPRADARRRHSLAIGWSRSLLGILGIRVRRQGRPPGRGAGAMIAANHVSWADIFVIGSVRHTRFIAKSEIRDWPIAGWLADKSGTIFIRRARRHDTARINATVHDALAEGECVALFPEGTTTEGDRLLKFHTSLFEPAVANAARVYPAGIRYERPDGTLMVEAAYVGELTFAQSLGMVIRARNTNARVAFAEPIETSGLSRQEAAAEARRRVASLLGLPIPETGPGKPADPAGAPP